MSDFDIFAARDAFLVEHPDIAEALEIVTISERRIREAQQACIIIETWRNGELVERVPLNEYLRRNKQRMEEYYHERSASRGGIERNDGESSAGGNSMWPRSTAANS